MKTLKSKSTLRAILLALAFVSIPSFAEELELKPDDAQFARYQPLKAPKPTGLLLRKGDRLAICGDSITEQKMYSRIIETYLTACQPQLEISVRQFGWSGERAPGFLARMTNDCLRFKPTIATTCYGMNDHEYRVYEDRIGNTYRENSLAIVRAFKAVGARVIQGSPGCVGKKPSWSKAETAKVDDLNENLCRLRNIGIEIARSEQVGFADVFWPMLTAGYQAQKRFGTDYAIAGKDGVHPDWAGQVMMATAFLKAMGLDGDLGTITVDLASGTAKAENGHDVLSFRDGVVEVRSSRLPFCATGPEDKDNSIPSGMALSGFQGDLNRLTLVGRGGKAARYKVQWGPASRTYSAAQLETGIPLAQDFPVNPLSEAFARVDAAVAAKQDYETRQIKSLSHGPEGKTDMNATAALTEKVRAPLAAKVRKALTPVTHKILVTPE